MTGLSGAKFHSASLRGEPLTIYGTGEQTRSFCYVSDLIEGIYRLMMTDEHLPVNIGNPIETSIKDFARPSMSFCQNPSGFSTIFTDTLGDDPQRRQPDITRARNILGWRNRKLRARRAQFTFDYMRNKTGLTPPGRFGV